MAAVVASERGVQLTHTHSVSDAEDIAEFRLFLQDDSYVDVARLKELSLHGVPAAVRREVWGYLCNSLVPNKSEQDRLQRDAALLYDKIPKTHMEFGKTIGGGVRRLCRRANSILQESDWIRYENVITSFLHVNRDTTFDSDLILLCYPFFCLFEREAEVFVCFHNFMNRMARLHEAWGGQSQVVSKIFRLIQAVAPELYDHFEEEEDANVRRYVGKWVNTLLVQTLDNNAVMRLWDTYLSLDDPMRLHMYVCASILIKFKEEIMELNADEIRPFLERVPVDDVDEIMALAQYLIEDTEGLIM